MTEDKKQSIDSNLVIFMRLFLTVSDEELLLIYSINTYYIFARHLIPLVLKYDQ